MWLLRCVRCYAELLEPWIGTVSYLKSRRSYNTQPQDHQISDDNPFKTFGSCHSWMIIDCYHLLFPLMLRKHSGAALSLHLFSNLRSPTGLKCRAVTGGLDSSDRFFCTQLPSRNWVLLAFAIVLFHHIPSNICPKLLARITILCGKTFLRIFTFPFEILEDTSQKQTKTYYFWPTNPNFQIPRNDHLKQHQNS